MFSQYFIGKAYLNMLTTTGVPIGNVTFEPACPNNWHIHHKGGQILLVTEGRGWYQEWGKEPQELHPGDVVNIPIEAILKVDLYGTAVLLEEIGKVIEEGGSGMVISSQSGYRLGELSPKNNK